MWRSFPHKPLTRPHQDIAEAIKANGVQSFWIGSSYLLTYAIVQPLIASLSDIFGRQALLFLAVICFTVGSIVAALAHGITPMLVGRVFQGVGGGGIQVLTVWPQCECHHLEQCADLTAERHHH